MPSYAVTPMPKAPAAPLFGKMGVMAGPQLRDTRPALTKAQQYTPGIGLGLGMEPKKQNGYLT